MCDPKPLASLIHNCTQILKAIEEKEKENAQRLEKAKKEKEKEKEKAKQKAEESVSSSGSNSRQTAMKSTSKPPRVRTKGALQMSNVNVSRVTGVKPNSTPLAVTQGGVTYIVQQGAAGGVVGQPQPGILYHSRGGKLVPVTPAKTLPQLKLQQAQQARNVQNLGMQQDAQVHTVIAEQWNINEMNVDQVLEKVLAATQSMNMLLYSLREDMKKKTHRTPPTENLRVRKEIAFKFKRAMQAYKKSFRDISVFSCTKSNVQKVVQKVQPKHGQTTSQPHSKKSAQPAKKVSSVEVIELSDSEDDESTSQASASTTKSSSASISHHAPVASTSTQHSVSAKGKASENDKPKRKSGQHKPLKIAMFHKGSPRKKKNNSDSESKGSDHKDSEQPDSDHKYFEQKDSDHQDSEQKDMDVEKGDTGLTDKVTDDDSEVDMDFEVTEIDLDEEENIEANELNKNSNDVKTKEHGSDDGGSNKPESDNASSDNKDKEEKVENGLPKADVTNTDDEDRSGSSEPDKAKSSKKANSSGGKDDLFASLDLDPLFDVNSLSSGKRSASNIGDEEESIESVGGKKQKVAKRSREDIEAQRILHKELMEDTSDGEQAGVKTASDKQTTTTEDTSTEVQSAEKTTDEDYVPVKERSDERDRSRVSKQKSKAVRKFKGENSSGSHSEECSDEVDDDDDDDDDVIMVIDD